jgi:hypothetical protein
MDMSAMHHDSHALPVATEAALRPPLSAPAAGSVAADERAALLDAGREIRECLRVLEKAGLNVVGEVLRGQGEFIELEHYPRDDVTDDQTRSQYYYHAHRDSNAEHGHFHTFVRTGRLERPPSPAGQPHADWPQGSDALAHLIGIAMDDWGYPLGLFATNRWVTGETWYPADTVLELLPRFDIDHAYPSWPTNRWIGAMLRLFRPHIRVLLQHRDATVAAWRQNHPGTDVLEDRRLEVTGYLPISVDAWLHQLAQA